jgi:hypothetical protein
MTAQFWARSSTDTVVQRAQNQMAGFWARSSTDAVVLRAQNGWDGATP